MIYKSTDHNFKVNHDLEVGWLTKSMVIRNSAFQLFVYSYQLFVYFIAASTDASSAPSNGGNVTESTGPSSSSHLLPTCAECNAPITAAAAQFVWETMQFCTQECLSEYIVG